MNHFKVTAKCGHVGKRQYYKGVFFIRAEDGKQAAAIVREKPRVKHDRKDAILAVEKISYAEYKEGRAAWRGNRYFSCHSRQEQVMFLDEIAADIYNETGHDKYENVDKHGKLKVMRRHYRKMDKYNKLGMGA